MAILLSVKQIVTISVLTSSIPVFVEFFNVIMPKPIKSSVRSLLFTMINKYNHVKIESDDVFTEKRRLLDEIVSTTATLDDELIKSTIDNLVKKVIAIDENKKMKSETDYLTKIAAMTDLSVKTLRRIKKEGAINQGEWNTPGKKRPRQPTVANLDNFDLSAIRNKINEFYCVKKQVPTLRSLLADLRESIGFTGCHETLRQLLLKNGFEFKKNKNERSLLIEKYELAAWRHRYLRAIDEKRKQGKLIVYLDETYVHQNYKVKKSWQGPSTSGVIDKISSGKRHIVVHAGSEKGFVPNALLVFSTKSKMADYHDDMNRNNFMKWLCKKLIPNLSQPSVIVMDNASYHVTQINKPPSMNDLKADIQKWLTENGIHYEEFFTKAELMCLVNEHKTTPMYEAEEFLKQHGHEVLKLPPYHCDLNAIELIWSLAKRKIASKNLGIPSKEMENLIKECFNSVTANDWKKCTDHTISVENKYKVRDRISETELEPFIISVRNDSTDSDFSFEGIEFLDSDFSSDE